MVSTDTRNALEKILHDIKAAYADPTRIQTQEGRQCCDWMIGIVESLIHGNRVTPMMKRHHE